MFLKFIHIMFMPVRKNISFANYKTKESISNRVVIRLIKKGNCRKARSYLFNCTSINVL